MARGGWRAVRFSVRHPGFARTLFFAVTLAAAVAVATWLMTVYLRDLATNRVWVEEVRVLGQDRMLRVVFDRAIEAELIWAEIGPDGPRVGIVSCENRREGLPPEGVPPRGDFAQKNKEVLSLLCTTDQGAQIREEIRQWNDSEYLLAVRDNRRKPALVPGKRVNTACDVARPDPRRAPQAKPPTVAFATIPRRCLLNRWDMFMLTGDRDSGFRPIPAEARGPEPSATDFDFVAADGPVYMTDWASIIPMGRVGPLRDVDYRLASTVQLPPDGLVRIDLVGIARRISAGGANIDLERSRLGARETPWIRGSDGIEMRVGMRCNVAYTRNRDCANVRPGVPFAYVIEVRGPARRAVPVVIDARLQRNLPRGTLAELPEQGTQPNSAPAAPDEENEVEEENEQEGWDLGTRTPNLIVQCPDDLPAGATTACTVTWRDPIDNEEEEEEENNKKPEVPVAKKEGEGTGQGGRPVAPTYQIQPSDQAINLVTSESGEFTPASLELGLAPVVGGGAAQWGSMAWALRAAEAPTRSAALTINLREQQVIRDVLEARRANCNGPAPAKDCVFRNPGARAVVALIDASKERAGEIRAMASWPPGQTGSHVWDLAASGGGGGRKWRGAATAPTAWSVGYDGLSQPGSTFKVVTALAAAEAVLKRQHPEWDKIRRLLMGEMSLLETVQFLDLRQRVPVPKERRSRDCRAMAGPYSGGANMLFVPRRTPGQFSCLQNFEDLAHARYFDAANVSGCPPAQRPQGDGRQLGMCEALMRSSNLFFGGLSFKLDGAKVMQGGREREGRIDNLDLDTMAARLVPTARGDAGGYDLMRGSLPRPAPLLRLDRRPITIEAAAPRGRAPDRRVITATSGYGQNVYAAPLAMASVYASIATGSIVRPRLVPRASALANPADPDENAPLLQAGTEQERALYLGILRAGLHGVVGRPGGSATSFFSSRRSPGVEALGRRNLLVNGDRPRLFGKTGTATVSKRFNTLWFAGWIDANPDRGIKTPMAFICQAIQQPRGQKLTGGSVCGPIIREILLRLDQKPGEQAETPADQGRPRTRPRPRRFRR